MRKSMKWLIVGVCFSCLFYFGCSKKTEAVDSVSTSYVVYWQAEYSDYDASWSDLASVVWEVYSVNDSVVEYTCPASALVGVKCSRPVRKNMNRKDLDRIDLKEEFVRYVNLANGKLVRTQDKSVYLRLCANEMLLVDVRYFFGKPVSVELSSLNEKPY